MAGTVIAEVHVVPLGTSNTSLSSFIAASLEPLKKARDVTFELTAMGTIIQGPLDRVLEVVRQMHEVPFQIGATRVYTSISIDDRRDKIGTIDSKVRSVKEKGDRSEQTEILF